MAAKLGYGKTCAIDGGQGPWLYGREAGGTGWVFAGNVSETKSEEGKGLDLPLAASETSATAAARPLTPAASDYAKSRKLTNARADLEWLLSSCAALTSEEVDAFLQEQKKGEYQ